MTPGFMLPVETRQAPTRITRTSPVFNSILIRGLEAAMVMLAVDSSLVSCRLTVS